MYRLRFQGCQPKLGRQTTPRLPVSPRRAGSRTSELTRPRHRCTCMLTVSNSEKRSLVLYVLRLGRFISSMSLCLASALRRCEVRCELRHSVTLKAELRRSIEVKLSWPEIIFVAELSTVFKKSQIYQLLPFAFDAQSGGRLVLLEQNISGSLAPSLSPSLQGYRIMLFLSCKKKKKKKEKRTEDIPAAVKTDICAFWLKPLDLHFVSSIQVWKTLFSFGGRNLRAQSKSRDSTNDGSTWRFLLVARHAATLGLWRVIPRVGELPFLKGFSLWTNQSERV